MGQVIAKLLFSPAGGGRMLMINNNTVWGVGWGTPGAALGHTWGSSGAPPTHRGLFGGCSAPQQSPNNPQTTPRLRLRFPRRPEGGRHLGVGCQRHCGKSRHGQTTNNYRKKNWGHHGWHRTHSNVAGHGAQHQYRESCGVAVPTGLVHGVRCHTPVLPAL